MRTSRLGLPALIAVILTLGACSLEKLRIPDLDFSALRDGTYEGSAFAFPVKVRMRATVHSGRLERLELLEHFNGQGKPAEALLPRVVEAQSLGVDVVAGATHSSKVILAAIGKALSKAAR